MIPALLMLAVLGTWLGCVGFARLPTAYARLHCVPFIALTGGIPIAIVAFLADGPSSRAWKILFLVLAILVTGSASSHATGRAIALREMNRQDK